MVDGIVKSAPTNEPVVLDATPEPTPFTLVEDIPIEIYRYFDIDVSEIEALDSVTKKHLKGIFEMLEGDSIGDLLLNLSGLERELGYPAMDESRHGRLWNHLKLSNRITDLKKQQEAMRRG